MQAAACFFVLFIADRQSFQEALQGQPVEEVFGVDQGMDQSYRGYGADAHPDADASAGGGDENQREANLQTASTQESVYSRVQDDKTASDQQETSGPQSFPFHLYGNRPSALKATDSSSTSSPSTTESSSSWDDDPESSTYFPVLPTPRYEHTSESSQRNSNFLSSSSTQSVDESRDSNQAVARSFYSPNTFTEVVSNGNPNPSSASAGYPLSPSTATRRIGVYDSGAGKETTAFSVDHRPSASQSGYTASSREKVGHNWNTDPTGIYERAGFDRNSGPQDYEDGFGGDSRSDGYTPPTTSPTTKDKKYGSGVTRQRAKVIVKSNARKGFRRRGGSRIIVNDYPGDDYDQSYGSSSRSSGLFVYGDPGNDFPIFRSVPRTGFSCSGRLPGYYADIRSGCQAFYICQSDGRMDGFLCPNATIFSQQLLTCDYWLNVDCSQSERFFSVNERLFIQPVRYGSGSSSRLSGRQPHQVVYDRGVFPSSPASNRRNDYNTENYPPGFETIDRRGERRQYFVSPAVKTPETRRGLKSRQQSEEYAASSTKHSDVYENPAIVKIANAAENDSGSAPATQVSARKAPDDEAFDAKSAAK